MSLSAFNRMRRLKARQAAEETAKMTPQEPQNNSLDEMTYQELRALAKEKEVKGFHKMDTEELREVLKGGGNDSQGSESNSEGQAGEEGMTEEEGE